MEARKRADAAPAILPPRPTAVRDAPGGAEGASAELTVEELERAELPTPRMREKLDRGEPLAAEDFGP